MPRRLLLDGEDLPALMLRVKAEMGPNARIVKAERIRDGGFAGFFARERYELVVEVPDPPTARERMRAVRAREAAGIDALLEAADEADVDLGDGEVVVAEAEAGEPEPLVSTSTDTFAQVLASMRSMVGPEQGGAQDAAEGGGQDAASAAAEAPAEPAAPARRPADAPPLMTWPVVPAPERDDVADEVDAMLGEVEVEVEADAEVVEVDVVVEPEPTPVAPAYAMPAVAPAVAPSDEGVTVARLLELGVPVRLLEGFGALDETVPLPLLVRRFTRPPGVQLSPGSLVVVVGSGDHALRTAAQMAQRARLDAHDVLLAGEIGSVAGHGRRLLTVAAAARVRSRLREDAPTLVALGVGPTASGTVAAATLLQALDPDQAWGVLDAGARGAQMRRWLRDVGERRPIDAVAAVNTFEAQAPGTVLDLGTPVGWVDGLPATPVVWAALLSERLAEDASDA